VVHAKGDKALAKEKLRRQELNKAWFAKKLSNDAYYSAVDAPTIAGCQRSIARTKKLIALFKKKLRTAKTPRMKKRYIGALSGYKLYGETLVEILKAFKEKESGKVSTNLFPILRKCEKRIAIFTGRAVERNYFFTPEVYPQYFKSSSKKEAEPSEKGEAKNSGQEKKKK
jgi:hypothetical protein